MKGIDTKKNGINAALPRGENSGGGGGGSDDSASIAALEAYVDSLKDEEIESRNLASLPLLCGQPMILFGAGTPQKAIVPENWIDLKDGGYAWNGSPTALGQVYINTSVTSNGRYTAIRDGKFALKWVNF